MGDETPYSNIRMHQQDAYTNAAVFVNDKLVYEGICSYVLERPDKPGYFYIDRELSPMHAKGIIPRWINSVIKVFPQAEILERKETKTRGYVEFTLYIDEEEIKGYLGPRYR